MRKQRALTLEQLAEMAGISEPHLSRLEKGKRLLLVPVAERLAKAMGVTTAEVLGLDAETIANRPIAGLREDFLPYDAKPGDPLGKLAGPNVYLYEVGSNALDKAGIRRGDVVAVSDDAETCKNPPPLAAVRVRLHPREDFMKPLTLLRQYVPPSLLVTNCSHGNEPSIDLDHDDAHIVGVIVSSHRRWG